MKQKLANNRFVDDLASNVSLLESFWNRILFHDMSIDSITRDHKRVIIRLSECVLILTEVTRFRSDIEEFPTPWLSQRLSVKNEFGELSVDAESGSLEVQFRNLRMLRTTDFAILIPSVDH